MTNVFDVIRQDVDYAISRESDGTRFFDLLDEKLCHGVYFRWLEEKLFDIKPYAAIGSGKFGWAFSMYMNGGSFPVFNFPGDLRHQRLVDPLVDPHFDGREFIYVDNSIYKGRTLKQINDYVTDWGGKILAAYVLYDGSRPPHSPTKIVQPFHYLYRWHDGKFRVE